MRQTTEVRFAQQFAFTYMQLNVMKHQNLVQNTQPPSASRI